MQTNSVPDLREIFKVENNTQLLYDYLVGQQEQIAELTRKITELENANSTAS